MDASKTDSGNTSGTMRGIEKSRNFKTEIKSRSLPANSEINSQTVCNINIKNNIINTEASVETKVFRRYRSSIFKPS